MVQALPILEQGNLLFTHNAKISGRTYGCLAVLLEEAPNMYNLLVKAIKKDEDKLASLKAFPACAGCRKLSAKSVRQFFATKYV